MPRPFRVALLPTLFLTLSGTAIAHERWVRHELLSDFDRSLFETANATNLGAFGGILILGAVIFALSLRTRRTTPSVGTPRPNLLRLGAATLGVLTGIGLLVPAYDGQFLAPDLVVDSSAAGQLLRVGGGAVGALLIVGLWVRPAAKLLVGLYALALLGLPFEMFDGESVPPLAILNYLDVVGIAVFLALEGRGACSIDERISPRPPTSPAQRAKAVGILRISIGLTLALLGAQKFLLPELPMGVVQNYQDQIYEPIASVTSLSPEGYVFTASLIELTVGFLVLIGVFTRVWIAVVAGLFVITAMIFKSELIGHLPIVGLSVILLIEGAGSLRLDDLVNRWFPTKRVPAIGAQAAGLVVLAALFGSLPSCSPTAVDAAMPQWNGTEQVFSITGEDARCRFEITCATDRVPLNQFFSIETRVFDAATGAPLVGGTLHLDGAMPSHDHGMASQPQTVELEGNRWITNGCKLHMYGEWVFQVQWNSGADADSASFEFPFAATVLGAAL
jgi:uncharacterized membrane protein YphA (DoxX/SURF4 family)